MLFGLLATDHIDKILGVREAEYAVYYVGFEAKGHAEVRVGTIGSSASSSTSTRSRLYPLRSYNSPARRKERSTW
jgi:hypothetical protein